MKRNNKVVIFIVLACFALALFACGGGGGGGFTPITYTGNAAQAIIDGSNAGELVGLAEDGGQMGNVIPVASAASESSASGVSSQIIERLATLSRELPIIVIGEKFPAENAAAVSLPATTEPCEFGGSMVFSGTWDDVNGSISVSITFNACNVGDAVLNGGATMFLDTDVVDPEGFPDPISSSIITTNQEYRNLQMTVPGSGSITTYGTVNLTIDQTPAQDPVIDMMMNLIMREDSTGMTAKIENYHMVITETVAYDEINISARIYDYDAGYVDVSTAPPLQDSVSGLDFGVLRLDGANGSYAEVDFSITSCDGSLTFNGTFDDGAGTTGAFCYLSSP